jgi:hypothetical protein
MPIEHNARINFVERSLFLGTKSPHSCKNQWRKIFKEGWLGKVEWSDSNLSLCYQKAKECFGDWRQVKKQFKRRSSIDVQVEFSRQIGRIHTNSLLKKLLHQIKFFSPWFELLLGGSLFLTLLS